MFVTNPQAQLIVLILLALFLIWRFLLKKSALSNIAGPPSQSWWNGNYRQFHDKFAWDFHSDLIKKYGGVVKLKMLLGDEALYVVDPLALHHIVVKDQYVYEETSMFISTNALLGVSLLSTLGEHHRKQRKMLNPVFSLKHMRDLVPIFYPIGYELRDYLLRIIKNGQTEIDILQVLHRAALEFIGRGGFGYSFGPLEDKSANDYSSTIKRLGPALIKTSMYRQLFLKIGRIQNPVVVKKLADWLPFKDTREIANVIDTLGEISRKIFDEKKLAFEKEIAEEEKNLGIQSGKGKDIMSVLLKANSTAKESDRLPEEELFGQMNSFIMAGQDTTSRAMSRILHVLSLNPDAQTKLREEIIKARQDWDGRDLDYDALMGLPYLDAVCRETLRVYPVVNYLARTARKDIILPLAWPIIGADGKTEIKEIPVPKNTEIFISVIQANRHKKIWGEDAEEWKPERWLKPLPQSVSDAHLPGVYSSMMSFLGGGRACIGFKFAELEIKLVLFLLLEKLAVSPGPEIHWIMAGSTRPTVLGQDNKIQLPLRFSLVSS